MKPAAMFAAGSVLCVSAAACASNDVQEVRADRLKYVRRFRAGHFHPRPDSAMRNQYPLSEPLSLSVAHRLPGGVVDEVRT